MPIDWSSMAGGLSRTLGNYGVAAQQARQEAQQARQEAQQQQEQQQKLELDRRHEALMEQHEHLEEQMAAPDLARAKWAQDYAKIIPDPKERAQFLGDQAGYFKSQASQRQNWSMAKGYLDAARREKDPNRRAAYMQAAQMYMAGAPNQGVATFLHSQGVEQDESLAAERESQTELNRLQAKYLQMLGPAGATAGGPAAASVPRALGPSKKPEGVDYVKDGRRLRVVGGVAYDLGAMGTK